MIISHEDNAPSMETPAPCNRMLKVLLSPVLSPELEALAAGLTILPAGGKSDDHEHHEGEMFYVVSGRGRIKIGDEEAELTTGTAVWGPAWLSHQLINDSDDVLKVLWVLIPPGREAAIIDENSSQSNGHS